MKCKDCIYLDLSQKTTVGYVCTNTKRRRAITRTLGHLKYKHTPACKTGFKAKENDMTVKQMVEKLRVNCLVEIRVNNFKVICVERDNIKMVKEELLDKEVDNWGIDNTGRLFATMDKIFVDVEGEC